MSGLQKSGYLNVKQPSNVKGRKLKSWKLKWVVLHKMSNISAGTFAAKVDLYQNEDACKKLSQDRMTYIFEHVTAIQSAESKTHKNAFEIVERVPVLALSALSDADTVTWIKRFQLLFWPAPDPDGKDVFQIIIEDNEDSKRFSLTGEYWLLLSPETLTVKAMSKTHCMEWKLCNLKRFNLDKHDKKLLIIESGAKSDIGEARFAFRSNDVLKIFQCIRKNILVAVEKRHRTLSTCSSDSRIRSSSASNSEKEFQILLENSQEVSNGRSSRESSPRLKPKIPKSPLTRHREFNSSPELKPKVGSSPQLKRKILDPISPNLTGGEENSSPLISTEVLENDKADETTLKAKGLSASYDELCLPNNKQKEPLDIVATEIIQDKDSMKEIQIGHDSKGYSHIVPSFSEISPAAFPASYEMQVELPKLRSASDQSSHSTDTQRSESISSRDSGCILPTTEKERRPSDSAVHTATKRKILHRSCNSFDSAISSTSVTSDKTTDSVEIPYKSKSNEALTTNDIHKNSSHSNIYADISQNRKTPYEDVKESEYEDLEKYRKDISKFLGMDPKINPADVPPSLPERPTTLPIRRKDAGKKSTQKKRKKKKVTFNRSKKDKSQSRSNSLSSTTSSNDEDDSENVTKVKICPINQLKLTPNSLYVQTDITNSPTDTSHDSDDLGRCRPLSDSALMDSPTHHYATAKESGYSSIPKKSDSPVIDLLTGDLINTPDTDQNALLIPHLDTRSARTVSIPPHVEQLIPLDIPPARNSQLVFESPMTDSEDKEIVFRAKDDGNFVWDPFPSIGPFNTSDNDIADKTIPNINGLSINQPKQAQYENVGETGGQPLISVDDPFDIFHMGFSAQTSTAHKSSNVSDMLSLMIDNPNNATKQVEESLYMDMRKPPVEDEYVNPSDLK